MIFERNCPQCKKILLYSSLKSLKRANNNNSDCIQCKKHRISKYTNTTLEKSCPSCNKTIKYSNIKALFSAIKKNSECKSCSNKRRSPLSEETKQKISKKLKGIKQGSNKKKGHVGKNNSMYGISVYNLWIKKYGEEKANELKEERCKKMSIKSSGKNNPMYGKPSPTGSGNGWSGWYKEWYFRSLRELSYMITEIEKKKLNWENGEQKKYQISYTDWKGKKRNYFPDFIVDKKYMIECKPIRLQTSVSVLSKQNEAKKFCKKHNLEYILLEPKILSMYEIKELYISKQIKFLPRYEEIFLKKYF